MEGSFQRMGHNFAGEGEQNLLENSLQSCRWFPGVEKAFLCRASRSRYQEQALNCHLIFPPTHSVDLQHLFQELHPPKEREVV